MVRRVMGNGGMERMTAVMVRRVKWHLTAVVLVAMDAGRIVVGQSRRGRDGEQSRAGGGDQ